MERSLHKGSTDMHVGYSSGDFSNNLHGKNFTFHTSGGKPHLRVDMSGNLRVQNKRQNCYLDALDCVKNRAALNHIQLDREMILDFGRQTKLPIPEWRLELDFGEKGHFVYSVVKLELDESSARFDVKLEGE